MTDNFNTLIHEPKRLQICAFLDSVEEVEFQILREHLALSESALSKHFKSLEEAGYITVDKRGSGRKRTWVSLNDKGKAAFKSHVLALQEIIDFSGNQ